MSLAGISLILGCAIAGLCACLIFKPEKARNALLALPRSKVAAWLFTGVGLLWAARLLWITPLGRFEDLKPLLVILTPVSFLLIVFMMDELLGARSLGGMFVLIPAPILEASRRSDAVLRLVVVVLAYIIAIQGIALVLSPYLLRKESAVLLKTNVSCRVCGTIGVLLGLMLIVLGIAVF